MAEASVSVWIDEVIPAHRAFSEVIEEQIDSARAVLVLWSAEAVRSHWVQSEANRAREAGKLVQVRLDASRLPMPFDRMQCESLEGWRGEADARGWRKAVASLVDLSGATVPAEAPETATKARANTAPLLAVLPFENLSRDEEMAYFSDGVSQEILHTVARMTSLKVLGRSSTFQLRGAAKAARNVADLLGASHVLDGSVRRSGERLRFYLGLAQSQIGNLREAVAIWRDLEHDSPAEAPWLPMLKEHIATFSKEGGFDPTTVLPHRPDARALQAKLEAMTRAMHDRAGVARKTAP